MATIIKGVRILDYDVIVQLQNTNSNCIVYKAQDPKTKKKFILKLVYRPLLHPELIAFLKNEFKTHIKAKHPNLVPIKKYLPQGQQFFLIYDFCEQGTLEGYLERRKFNVSLGQKRFLIRELLLAYSQIKKLGFFGRDLKLHNILISKNALKLGDIENVMKSHVSLKKHVFSYLAPEELSNPSPASRMTTQKDIWCLGIDIYYILFGQLPFKGLTKQELGKDIKRKVESLDDLRLFLQKSDAEAKFEEFYELLEKTLRFDPQERIDVEALLDSPVFKSQDFEDPIYEEVSLEEKEDDGESVKGNFLHSLFSESDCNSTYELPDELKKIRDSKEKEKVRDQPDPLLEKNGFKRMFLCFQCFFSEKKKRFNSM